MEEGNTSNASYNILGQPLVGSANGPGTTVNTYLYPGGPLTQTALYDGNNTLVRHVNPVYGNQGETLTATGDLNPATVAYDAWYRAIALSDGNHQTTWTTYGPAGYVSQTLLGNGDTYRATSWDLDGNVLSSTDARGVVTNFSYADPERQLTDVQHPLVPALDVHFSYDGYGRTASVADGTGTRSAAYDDNGATTSVTTTYRNAAGNGNLPPLTLGYAFYPDGSLSSMTTPGGSFSYGFDGRGLPTTMSNPQGQNFGWSYFDNGWLATQSLSNVATAAYSYDGLGQLTHLSHHKQDMAQTLLADFSGMTHDVVGNRLTLTTSVPNAPAAYSGSTGYQYDNRNQLTQEVSGRAGGYSNSYAFDLVGNPTSWKGTAQTFNSANQNTQNGTLTFDGNGNPAGFSGTALNWDVNDNLYAFGNVLTAGYNADGLRAWKQTAAGRTYFLYNGIMPVCEVDGNGNVTAVNTWGATGLLARFVAGTGGGSVFYCFDPQGSASVRLDSGGNILSSHTNEAWGTQISTVATNDPYAGYGGQWGYYKDVETGLHLLGERYYDTSSGRFLNRDPIGYDGGINVYAYAEGNPVSGIDPTGLLDPKKKKAVIFIGDTHCDWFQWPTEQLGIWRDTEAMRKKFQKSGYEVLVIHVAHYKDFETFLPMASAMGFIGHNAGAGAIECIPLPTDPDNEFSLSPIDFITILKGRKLEYAIIHACYSQDDALMQSIVGLNPSHYEGSKGFWNPTFGMDCGSIPFWNGGKKRSSLWSKGAISR